MARSGAASWWAAPTRLVLVRDVRGRVQLLDPARSRTTWFSITRQGLHPSGYMTTGGQDLEAWPLEAEEDPRILLRIGDSFTSASSFASKRVQPWRRFWRSSPQVRRRKGDPHGGGDIRLLWLYELAPGD